SPTPAPGGLLRSHDTPEPDRGPRPPRSRDSSGLVGRSAGRATLEVDAPATTRGRWGATVSDSIGLLEGMSTTRSIRRFKSDPIPDDLLRSVLGAATWAPSGSNSQSWRLVVVRDPEKRRQIGEIYCRGFFEVYPAQRLAAETDPARVRMMTGAVSLAEHLGTEPPALVLFCQTRPTDPTSKSPSSVCPWTRGSSIYLAVQNLLLAARASGLGGCLTTVHLLHEQELK